MNFCSSTWTGISITSLRFLFIPRALCASIGRGRIGAIARALLFSSSTCFAALSPVSKLAPATIH